MGGVFIETQEPHALGQELRLSLSLREHNQAFQATAKVAWRGPNGVGLQFQELTEVQQHTLKSIVEKM